MRYVQEKLFLRTFIHILLNEDTQLKLTSSADIFELKKNREKEKQKKVPLNYIFITGLREIRFLFLAFLRLVR